MTSSSDRPGQRRGFDAFGVDGHQVPDRKPSFAERIAAEGEQRRPGHHEPSPLAGLFGRRAGDADGLAGGRRASDTPNARGGLGGGEHSRNPYARFVPREEVGEVSAWRPNAFGTATRQPPLTVAPDPAVEQRRAEEAARQAAEQAAARVRAEAEQRAAELRGAREGGYQDGYRDGLAAMEAFKRQHAAQAGAQVAAVVQHLQEQLVTLEQHLAQRVAGIALEVARQVVRTELHAHPDHVVQATQEALSAVLMAARHIVVRVHPDDHALIAQGLDDVLQARGARLVADADIVRGGCLVESDVGSVDARIATRWERASAAIGRPTPFDQDASRAHDAYDEDLPEPVHRPASDEGSALQAERRAAPSRPAVPSGAEPGHGQSGGLGMPGEGLRQVAQRGLQDRTTYPSDEGLQ